MRTLTKQEKIGLAVLFSVAVGLPVGFLALSHYLEGPEDTEGVICTIYPGEYWMFHIDQPTPNATIEVETDIHFGFYVRDWTLVCAPPGDDDIGRYHVTVTISDGDIPLSVDNFIIVVEDEPTHISPWFIVSVVFIVTSLILFVTRRSRQ